MFTGLIQETGKIISILKKSGRAVLTLKSTEIAQSANPGDSISVNGVCLTVVNKKGNELSFDLSGETLKCSNLGNLKPGDIVNLEPSLSPNSKIGGHFVTGHIDDTGKIRSRTTTGDMVKFEFEAPPEILNFLVKKGSVAIDGISLTVIDILSDSFTVIIIPHTAKLTTLGFKGPGDTVNIEVDILGKYVAKFLNKDKDSRLMKSLVEGGFI